ncbi:MAG: proteasome activator, partial [Acidimicrobiia bacterium]
MIALDGFTDTGPPGTVGSRVRLPVIKEPGKLLRVAAVARAMLDEARSTPCDAAGCERLKAIYLRTIEELEGLLPKELR